MSDEWGVSLSDEKVKDEVRQVCRRSLREVDSRQDTCWCWHVIQTHSFRWPTREETRLTSPTDYHWSTFFVNEDSGKSIDDAHSTAQSPDTRVTTSPVHPVLSHRFWRGRRMKKEKEREKKPVACWCVVCVCVSSSPYSVCLLWAGSAPAPDPLLFRVYLRSLFSFVYLCREKS